jgi:hypothetical protein
VFPEPTTAAGSVAKKIKLTSNECMPENVNLPWDDLENLLKKNFQEIKEVQWKSVILFNLRSVL